MGRLFWWRIQRNESIINKWKWINKSTNDLRVVRAPPTTPRPIFSAIPPLFPNFLFFFPSFALFGYEILFLTQKRVRQSRRETGEDDGGETVNPISVSRIFPRSIFFLSFFDAFLFLCLFFFSSTNEDTWPSIFEFCGPPQGAMNRSKTPLIASLLTFLTIFVFIGHERPFHRTRSSVATRSRSQRILTGNRFWNWVNENSIWSEKSIAILQSPFSEIHENK